MPGDGGKGGPDLSMSAVNARLRAFIAEHRAAEANGERRPFRESDALLCAMAEDALEAQARADLAKAEAQAKAERTEYEQRGGRLQ